MQARTNPDDFRPAMPPGYMPRSDFLRLCDLSVGTYTSLVQRQQLPLMPPPADAPGFLLQEASYPVPDSDLEWFDARGWSPFAALAYLAEQAFVDEHKCSRDFATAIARRTLAVHQRWPEIAEAVDRGEARGDQHPHPNILLAAITCDDGSRLVDIGTLQEIGSNHPSAAGIIAISLTKAALTLRRRAVEQNIDINGFWHAGR